MKSCLRRSGFLAVAVATLVGPRLASAPPAVAAPGDITEFPLPNPGDTPLGITGGPDGAVWYAEH